MDVEDGLVSAAGPMLSLPPRPDARRYGVED